MILDIPYRSKVYDLQKDSAKLLAYLEEIRHEYTKGNFKVFYTVQHPDCNQYLQEINSTLLFRFRLFSFQSKEAAMNAIKKYYKL